MRVGRMVIFDGIEVEEARVGDARGGEGLVPISIVVWEEPRCTEGNDSWRGGDL